MNKLKLLIKCLPFVFLVSCGETKTIFRKNKIYKYVNNQGTHINDQVIEYTVIKRFKSKLKDKIDYYQVLNDPACYVQATDTTEIDGERVSSFSGLGNTFYTSESNIFMNNEQFENKPLKFYYGKFALTAMTIPLKYRSGVGNDELNPPTFETGINVNFAPSYRFNWSIYDNNKKILGSNLTNYSITLGGLLGIGATDLKTKTNAIGLLSDRKSAVSTYGAMVLFGFNNIGIGYSIGFDNILGEGSKYWVYQNKAWHGITISVDIVK